MAQVSSHVALVVAAGGSMYPYSSCSSAIFASRDLLRWISLLWWSGSLSLPSSHIHHFAKAKRRTASAKPKTINAANRTARSYWLALLTGAVPEPNWLSVPNHWSSASK